MNETRKTRKEKQFRLCFPCFRPVFTRCGREREREREVCPALPFLLSSSNRHFVDDLLQVHVFFTD